MKLWFPNTARLTTARVTSLLAMGRFRLHRSVACMTLPNEPTPAGLVARRSDMAQFVEFQVGDQCYAFAIGQIREIIVPKDITPTPMVAPHVDGVSNLRGAIIPIINLRVLLGLPRRSGDDETRTIVVHVGDKLMGCTVDRVKQVLRVEKNAIRPAPDTVTAGGRDYIRGFIKQDERLVIVVDVDWLLQVDRLHAQPASSTSPQDRSPQP